MRVLRTVFLVFVVAMAFTSQAPAQECGDVDGSGMVTLGDLTLYAKYLFGEVPVDSINVYNSDCDYHTGLTAGDYNALLIDLFIDLSTLSCPPGLTYTFPTAEADTIFLPSWQNIPEDIDSIAIPVRTNFADTSHILNMYLVFVNEGSGPDAAFQLDTVIFNPLGTINSFSGALPDTGIVLLSRTYGGGLHGERQDMILVAKRTAAGPANFAPQLTDRDSLLRTCVSCYNFETYLPIVVHYDFLPRLLVSPEATNIEAIAGESTADTVQFDFTSDNSLPIDFSLTWSSAWLEVLDYTDPLQAPVTIHGTADASTLEPGVYMDTIRIVAAEPGSFDVPVSAVPVTLTVRPPQTRPFGDLNCDGAFGLADLSILIYHLFLNPSPIPPCQ